MKSDRYDPDLADKTISIQNFPSIESYVGKTAEIYRNCYVVEKRSFQTIKDIDSEI